MPEMLDESAVTPKSGVTPPPEQQQQPAPADTGGAELPDEVLKIPAIQGLLAGAPAAVSAKVKNAEKTPEGKAIVENRDALMGAGVAFYRSLSGSDVVLFNQLRINGEDIKAADKAGKLLQIAPPFDVVNREIAKAGPESHPTLNFKGVPAAPAGPQAALPPQSATMPMPAAPNAAKARIQAQIKNLQPQAPTAGSKPGSGNILRSILRPVL